MLEYELLYLVVAGLFLGLFSAIFGVGGGVVVIPTLQLLTPELIPQEWVGTSFAVILLTSCLNSYLFARQKLVFHKKVIIPLGAGLCAGIIIGQQLSFLIPTRVFFLVFGLTLFALGGKSLFFPKKIQRPPLTLNWPVHLLVGLLVGALSGLVGIGGGTLLIPYLMFTRSIPIRLLSFHSNVMMIFGSFFGVTNYMLQARPESSNVPLEAMSVGLVHWGMALCFWVGIILTAKLGVLGGQKLSEKRTNQLFAFILFALGARFLFKLATSL